MSSTWWGMVVEMARWFSFFGRASRTEFWLINLALAALIVLPAYLFFGRSTAEAGTWLDVLGLLSIWPLMAVQARRWHDRKKSAWWLLINVVPVIGVLWVVIENGFLPSVDEGNPY